MVISSRRFINFTGALLFGLVFILITSVVKAQSTNSSQAVASATKPSANSPTLATGPVFKDYRGVTIGMTVKEVRSSLDRIKEGKGQDYLLYSEGESAQIYYDNQGKVTAVSIDYFGDSSKAPTPDEVLGVSLKPRADGSMYQLNRYPEAGYWVSYNRTAGDKPIVTITMQKI